MFHSEAITTKILKKATTIEANPRLYSEWGKWKGENWLPHWTCQADTSIACFFVGNVVVRHQAQATVNVVEQAPLHSWIK